MFEPRRIDETLYEIPADARDDMRVPARVFADEGAGALALHEWDDVEVDLAHHSLRGVDDVFEALISSCSADVFVDV